MWTKKFRLLCWKNWILVKRHWIQAIFEILFPIAIVLFFSYARDQIPRNKTPSLTYPSFQLPTKCYFSSSFMIKEEVNKLGFSPDNDFFSKIMESVGNKLGLETFGLEDEESLEYWIRNQSTIGAVAAIQFESLKNNTSGRKHLKYTIRLPEDARGYDTWKTDQMYYVSPSQAARPLAQDGAPYDPPYKSECFLSLQNKIDHAFIKILNAKASLPSLTLQAYPYPSVVDDVFLNVALQMFPFLFVICMIMAVKSVIKNITLEIETSIKESMKMMGLNSVIFWSSWFTKSFVMMIIPFTINVVLMTTTLMTQTPMFAHSSVVLIWIFFVIYITSVVTFCFLMSVLFKKSTTAGTIGTLVFFLAIFPYNSFGTHFHSFPYFLKAVFCMLVNTNMGQAMSMILGMESNEQGIQFSTLFHRDINTRFSFGELLIFMIVGCIIHLLLTNYIEKVFPGEFGIAQPFYYPLMPCLNYLKKRMGYRALANEAILQERKVSNSDIEDEPENLNIGIKIQNMSKKFGDKFAVNKLSLNMFEDQITVLLGHNGAGKTTTFSMLIGLFSPSSGTAYLNGKDIRTELNEARASVGICFQHNVLFEELTVKEHLTFFCALKGIEDKRAIAEDVRKYISLLDLKDKTNAQSCTLSGGMKRKLSIGIALCGNAKIVILDEPTSGIDVAARRHLWDLLIAEKKDRTILLSTHFMDEADVLGDRIAIMTEGRLRTVGSSFFLKKKFGTGYRLTCVKNEAFVSENVQKVVEKYAPDVYIDTEVSTEATYVISEDKLPMFQHIFRDLEDNSDKLGINSFGCSLSTLEEVFLKLGVESYHDEDEADGHARSQSQVELSIEQGEQNRKVNGINLTLCQIEAVLLKKFHVFRRTWKQLTYIAGFNVLMLFIVMSSPTISFKNSKTLNISFNTYEDTQTVLKGDNSYQLAKSYQSLFSGKDKITVLKESDFISDYILKKSNESLARVNTEYLVGATITENLITAWFNGQPYHALPLTINTVNRALLKNVVGSEYDISVSNKPYNLPIPDSDGNRLNFEDPEMIIKALLVLYFLLTSWSIIFIAACIKEKELRAKLLQYISGLNRYTYWITSFIFDFCVFIIISILVVCGIGAFQQTYFSTVKELSTLLVISVSYGFAFIPFSYAFSYLFAKHSTGESILTLVAYGLALLYGILRFLLFIWSDQFYRHIVKVVYWIGLLFGPFSFVDQLSKLGMSILTRETIFSFKELGIGWNIALCIVSGYFFLAFCIVKDHLLFEKFFYKSRKNRALPPRNPNMDQDVKDEIDKVQSMSSAQIKGSKLVLQGLTKYYGNFLAVNQLYLDVEQRDCFGLLGVNGSGKTSTFKMMTGDELISSGEGWVNGHSIKNELSKVHEQIGYTPQFDAVILELTGYETLKIFSLIRGLPRRGMDSVISHMANEFGFAQHLHKQIKAFSGGNKRKLSTALALLGNPQLIFLDEPTTGIDPQAKHHMWTIIKKIRDSGRAVVITSHSMDECEALCTKIGIMVSGEFKCLGSVQHLKNKYSKGFVLTIKMGKDDEQLMMNVQNRVRDAFQLAELKEKYLDILTFHITNTQLKWSEMFRVCANLKEELDIQDYALTQMSLEQVFMIFSKSGIYQQNSTD